MVLKYDPFVSGGESEPRVVPCRFIFRLSLGPVGGEVVLDRGSFTTCSGLVEKFRLERKHQQPTWRHMRRVRRLHKAQLNWKVEQLFQVRLNQLQSMVRSANNGTCRQMSTIRERGMGKEAYCEPASLLQIAALQETKLWETSALYHQD